MTKTQSTRDAQLELLQRLRFPREIASILGVKYASLAYHIYKTPPERRYRAYSVAKRRGGVRVINAPSSGLKFIQRQLNELLSGIYEPKDSTHGFIYKRSVVTNAQAHTNQRFVFNIDIKDFFPTINFGRVRGMLMARPYFLHENIATVLAQICCHNNQLPQGAPTSPIISNMICAKLDSNLGKLAKESRCTYSRYADDITFSTSLGRFPESLAEIRSHATGEIVVVGRRLREVVEDNGFLINELKVRLQHRSRRQEVTGLITNRSVNVPRKFKNQLRAMLHAWKKHGYEAAQSEYVAKYQRKHRPPGLEPPSFLRVVRGKLEYIGMVCGKTSVTYQKLAREFYIVQKQPIPWDAMEVFFSYSHKDEALRDELAAHLSRLQRENVITSWHDRRIVAGTEWKMEIDTHLDSASIILLLISADFINSDYCWGKELKRALERHSVGSARVVPVILRECDWKGSEFSHLQAVPKDGKAVTSWANRDEAFTDVALRIRETANELRSGRQNSSKGVS